MKHEQSQHYGVWIILINIIGGKSKTICSFDVDEETKRREPWTGSQEDFRKNLDAFLSGGTFFSPSGNGINYTYNNFIEKHKSAKFIESLGEYTYDVNNAEINEDDYNLGTIKERKKRVIIYTLQN